MTQTTVRIIKNWGYPDLMQQSPGGLGVWGDIRFVEGENISADYVVVLNQPAKTTDIIASPDRVWAIIQEPPSRYHRFLHRGQSAFGRIYTSDPSLPPRSPRYRASQPALAWHVDLGFDELDAMQNAPSKSKDVSWITSTLAFLPGHKLRLGMLQHIRSAGIVDIFGRGLNPIARKWDGLAPYRYSIAFENHIGPHYWSEKLADCFLAVAMPIYVGCTNLEAYFPAGSFVRIDPRKEDPVAAVRAIVESDLAERNHALVLEARRRVLHEHQLFPFVANQIAMDSASPAPPVRLTVKTLGMTNPIDYGMAVWYWKVSPLMRATLARLSRPWNQCRF